jgi:NADH-quinone oxidoreductase subunit M
MPVYGTLSLLIVLSSMGLPGMNGFVGEFTILTGAFSSATLSSPWYAGVGALGVILSAVYLLHFFQKIYLGPVTHEENRKLRDISAREIIPLAAILILVLWIGLYPKPFFNLITPAVDKLVAILQAAQS